MSNKLDFIAYYFLHSDGVGSQRATYLYNYLKLNGYSSTLLSRKTFGNRISTSRIRWSIKLFFYLLNSSNEKIYVTCGPFYFLPIIWFAGKVRNKKIIYDFRDPWSFNIERGYGDVTNKGKIYKILFAKIIEKIIYRDCYKFWVCTNGMYDLYKNLFQDDEKIELVPNGYEYNIGEILKNNDDNENTTDSIKFVCLGRMAVHGVDRSKEIFQKLKTIIECKPDKQFQIMLVGTEKEQIERIIKELKLEKYVKFYPKQEYINGLKIAAKSDIGICLVREQDYELGTKAFDYIGMGLPILDVFDHSKNFYKYFSEYIIDIRDMDRLKKYIPPVELSRNYIFSRTLKYF